MITQDVLLEYPIRKQSQWSRESIIYTLGCCWDADRLDLLRLEIIPNELKMSTPYWQEILPLAAKLNKMTYLFDD